jgi:hypothetical protein
MPKSVRFTWERKVASVAGPGSPTTRHVLLTLATHADRAGKAFPSIKTLAGETGLSGRAVVQHVQIAVQDGWLMREKTKRDGQGWRRSTYWLRLPAKGNESGAPPSPIEGGESGAARSRTQGAETDAIADANEAQGADSECANVVTVGQSNNVLSISENNSKSTTPWKEFADLNGIARLPGEKDLPYQLRVIALRATERGKIPG